MKGAMCMATRKLLINDKEHYFNFSIFKSLFLQKKKKDKLCVSVLEEKLANAVNKSPEAIHNWRFETNGPNDIETVELIAKFFNIRNYKLLLTERKNENMTSELSEIQMLSVKRIYDGILDYLEEFLKSNGFNDYWFDLDIEPKHRQGELCDIVTNKVEEIILLFKKEYIFLKNTKIYSELDTFIYNDLYDIFDGKLSYGYRFESQVDGNPTTDDDYYQTLEKLNKIINKYI